MAGPSLAGATCGRTGATLGATAGLAAGLLIRELLPSVLALRTVRLAVCPGWSGVAVADHVALTIDDGPHPRSTPELLDLFATLDVRATFFLVGAQLRRWPDLGRSIVAAGHEVAVHGFEHRPHLLRAPHQVARDVRTGRDCVAELTGTAPRFWRPPHGIPTRTGVRTAVRLGLRPALWTADGHDWRRGIRAQAARSRLQRQLSPGGTVLLHDAGFVPTSGPPLATDVLPELLEWVSDRGWRVGPLSDHEPMAATRYEDSLGQRRGMRPVRPVVPPPNN